MMETDKEQMTMITVSRSEIEKLQTTWVDGDYYINKDTLLNLLDKAESQVGPVVELLRDIDDLHGSIRYIPFEGEPLKIGQLLYTSPPYQIAKIAEREAEVARLNAIT